MPRAKGEGGPKGRKAPITMSRVRQIIAKNKVETLKAMLSAAIKRCQYCGGTGTTRGFTDEDGVCWPGRPCNPCRSALLYLQEDLRRALRKVARPSGRGGKGRKAR